MYAKLTCRLIGWIYLCLGGIGFFNGKLGEYMIFTRPESITNLLIGVFAVMLSRRRTRYAVAGSFLLGLILCTGGFCGLYLSHLYWIGTAEPLDSALRFVAGLWGLYSAISDIILWRKMYSLSRNTS